MRNKLILLHKTSNTRNAPTPLPSNSSKRNRRNLHSDNRCNSPDPRRNKAGSRRKLGTETTEAAITGVFRTPITAPVLAARTVSMSIRASSIIAGSSTAAIGSGSAPLGRQDGSTPMMFMSNTSMGGITCLTRIIRVFDSRSASCSQNFGFESVSRAKCAHALATANLLPE